MNKSKTRQVCNLANVNNKEKMLKQLKRQVKRNNTNCISSNNNSTINISRSSNKFNNRTKWDIFKISGCSIKK